MTRVERMEPWPLVAYRTTDEPLLHPEPASPRRGWMDDSPNAFARRCLPLVIANQSGWVFRLPMAITARWDGTAHPGGLTLDSPDQRWPSVASDHFGLGVLTFHLPYVFRTPPDVQLAVRGAPNFWVAGAHPLEGLVESDWASAGFTMNWKIVTPGVTVTFRAGDPICFMQPVAIDLVDRARPELRALGDDGDLERRAREFERSRIEFNQDLDRTPGAWQRHYFTGRHATGEPAEVRHRTRLRVAPFDGAGELHLDLEAPDRIVVQAPALELPVPPPGQDTVDVRDASGAVHQLNVAALFVLAAAQGPVSESEIAELARDSFGLAEEPLDVVRAGVDLLLGAGLLVDLSP